MKKVEIRRITKLIAEAAAFGDLKENAGYHEARNQKSLLLGRIEQLEGAINEAIVVEKKEDGKIQVGSQIVILFDDKEENYHMVASAESDILKNKISYQSPFGQKLIGKKAGEEFNYEISGKKIKVTILKVN